MAPKDKEHKCEKSSVICQFRCPHSNCQQEYIGESGRSFGHRLKEHVRAPSPIHHHSLTKGHPVNEECFTIVGKESQGVTRTIKEAMYICVNDPSLKGIRGNTSCPTYWMRHFRTLHHYGSSNSAPPLPLLNGPLPYHTICWGCAQS